MSKLLAVKPLKQLMHEAEGESGVGLKRALGPVNLAALSELDPPPSSGDARVPEQGAA